MVAQRSHHGGVIRILYLGRAIIKNILLVRIILLPRSGRYSQYHCCGNYELTGLHLQCKYSIKKYLIIMGQPGRRIQDQGGVSVAGHTQTKMLGG